MTFNPNSFSKYPVVDTCAVWHVLSSDILYRTAHVRGCQSVISSFVLYELVSKPRRQPDANQLILRDRFMAARASDFGVHAITLNDLSEISTLVNRKQLGIGEISSICLAKKLSLSFQTDDRQAKKLAIQVLGVDRVQTTCHMLGWLVYNSALNDSQVQQVITQHESVGGKMRQWLTRLYEQGLHFRLMATNHNL